MRETTGTEGRGHRKFVFKVVYTVTSAEERVKRKVKNFIQTVSPFTLQVSVLGSGSGSREIPEGTSVRDVGRVEQESR